MVIDPADDLLQDVLHGHDAGRPAVLVDHDRELLARLTEFAQQRAEILGLGDDGAAESRTTRDDETSGCR